MKKVTRLDSLETVKRFDSHPIGKNVKVSAQGFLIIPAFTARTGIQNYKTADGKTLREMRFPDEVFSESSMGSLRTAVVTDGHPKEMVNPDNVKELGVGYTNGIVTRETVDKSDESFLGTHIIVTHRDAIEAIQAGKAELSNGYNVDLEFTPGEHDGKKFDAIQRNIVNNHIAIVWNARGGKQVALKLDRMDGILITEKELNEMKVTINGKEFELGDDAGQAILDEQKLHKDALAAEKVRADSAEENAKKTDSENVKVLKEEKTALETESTKKDAKIDSLESDNKKLKATQKNDGDKNVDSAVAERMAVIETGKKMLDSKTVETINTMSNNDIKKAVIKVDSPKIEDSKLENDIYVDARFDTISEKLDGVAVTKTKIGDDISKNREDGNDEPEYRSPDQVRQDNMETTVDAGLAPINGKVE